ncbi:MAG: hypothetical protein WC289_01800 [Patescibacteria group bacterium]|jgi:hypothetical protein
MDFYKKHKKSIVAYTLFFSVCLGILIFLYPVLKPVPPGVDAAVYINDVHWIIDHGTLPAPYQVTYHGSGAYTAPLTDLNLSLLALITGLDVVFPLFSLYQLFLILLLVISCYLVGRIYGNFFSVLLPVAVLGSFSIGRLFIGSTVSNLLAFTYIGFIYYFSHAYFTKRKKAYLVLIILLLVSLYLTHNYLTAPIFIFSYAVYVCLLFIMNSELRSMIKKTFLSINIKVRTASLIAIVMAFSYFLKLYIPIFKEAKNVFWQSVSSNKFMGIIPLSEFHKHLGHFIFTLGMLGLLFYVLQYKRNMKSSRLLPALFFVIIAILSQTYHIGVNFYFERVVFLAGTFIAIFATYFMAHLLQMRLSKRYVIVVTFMFVILIVSLAGNRMSSLYDASNKITEPQIKALQLLKSVSDKNDIVYSNINAVSETYHDSMLSDRDIYYFSTSLSLCRTNDSRCIALNTPTEASSIHFFKNNNIRYFLFLKNSYEGNGKLDVLISQYKNQYYTSIFSGEGVELFKLI